MAVTPAALIEGKFAENTATTQYTAQVLTIIDQFTAVNTSGSIATLTINLPPAATATSSANAIEVSKSLQPGESVTLSRLIGHVLDVGDSIATLASAANAISIRASGRQVT